MNIAGSTLGPGAISSFRDPAGRLFHIGGRIIRAVNKTAVADLQDFLRSNTAKTFTKNGRLVATKILDSGAASGILEGPEFAFSDGSVIVEHERLPFQN